tara:strand:- start:168676 stop:169428 length:753 start_codon:yes stop_codon:yes gene_type:complete
MHERQKIIVSGLITLLLVLTMGFFVHRDPRFAGSLTGGLLGVAAASLMLVPLLYLFVKRIPWLKRRVTPYVSMRTFLTVHIYAGVLAPILGVLHTGHKFQSPLGIALALMMLVVAVSGYLGRYLLGQLSTDIRKMKADRERLLTAHRALAQEIGDYPDAAMTLRRNSSLLGRAASLFVARDEQGLMQLPSRAIRISESISDLDLSIRTHSAAKNAFGRWLVCHILVAVVLYALLFIHVWSAWYFGIRWLP